MAVSATACMRVLLEKHKLPSDYDVLVQKIDASECTPKSIVDTVQHVYKTSKQKPTENQREFLRYFIDAVTALATIFSDSKQKQKAEHGQSVDNWNAFILDTQKDLSVYVEIEAFLGKEAYQNLISQSKGNTKKEGKATKKTTIKKAKQTTAGKMVETSAIILKTASKAMTLCEKRQQLIEIIRKFNVKNSVVL